MALSSTPPRVGLRQDGRTLPVLALRLAGHEVSLVLPSVPPEHADVALVLDWESGEVTELGLSLRSHESERCVTHYDVNAVDGDWQPFLAYLGGLAGAGTAA